MLSQDESEVDKKFTIPPKIKNSYKDFELLAETSSYKVFEAKSCYSNEKHTIRILDRSKEFVNEEHDLAATLFVKELLHLQSRCPNSVLTHTFEISGDGQQIACAILPYIPLSCQIDDTKKILNSKDPQMSLKLISDSLSDIEFLWKTMQIEKVMEVVGLEGLCFLKEKGAFFLSDWAKMFQIGTVNLLTSISQSKTSPQERLTSQELSGEIKCLALAILKLNGIDLEDAGILQGAKDDNFETYNVVIKSALEECFTDSPKLQNLLQRMLSYDPRSLPNLEELRIKEAENQLTSKPVPEEKKETKNQASKDSLPKKLIKITEEITPQPLTLLAWCVRETNNICVVDFNSKQSYATFDGAIINNGAYITPQVMGIPNTKLIVSLNHDCSKSANMEIFNISKKAQAKSIYSLGEVTGINGEGDATYNPKRSLLGAIPVTGETAYHLFNIDANTSNANDIVKLSRKSKWHPQYNRKNGNYITSIDFDPTGKSVATIDFYGTCLISDLNTDKYEFNLNMESKQDSCGRCRWSTNTDEPFLFIKLDENKLNILDAVKKAFMLRNPIELDSSLTTWIDVCQNNGNLLAAAGSNGSIQIFDQRKLKIVKTFDNNNGYFISCVRWNPSGDLLAITSLDTMVKVFDFKTEKILFTHEILDGDFASSVCFI